MNSHVGSWSPKRTPKSLEGNCRGQNSSPWKIIYIFENVLKRRCLKWACIAHSDIWNTSYGQKKGRESNWQFDSRPLKVKNRPNFLVCRWHATRHWKALDKGYNFTLNCITIKGLHRKLCASKVARVPVMGISGLPFGSPKTKSHLDVALVERHRIYYKGKGGGFLQVQVMVSLVCLNCLWLVLAPKMLQLCTNHFVLVLCKSVWVIEACHFFLVPSWSSNTPFYPSIVLRAKERASTPYSSVVFNLGLTFESFKELGVRQKKAMTALLSSPSCFFFCCSGKKRQRQQRCLLLWFHFSKEEDDEEGNKEEEDNFHRLLRWLCCTKWRHGPCFCGFVAKKVTTTMSSPSSMVVVWWKRWWLKAVFLPLFFVVFLV